jgi:TolA-binding protein
MSHRADLKENILASRLERLLQWILANRSFVLTLLGVSLAAILMASVFMLRSRDAKDVNLTRLGLAQSLISQQQFDGAAKTLEELRAQNPDGRTLLYVLYYQGVAEMGRGKFDKAAEYFTEAVNRSGRSPLRPLSLANLAQAQEQQKNYDAAADTYRKFLADYSNHFMAPRIQLGLGRSLLIGGKKDEAQKAFEQLVDLYPTSVWAENARQLMDKNRSR